MTKKTSTSATISLFSLAFAILQRDVFVYVLSILTGVVVARMLGPEMLGVWVLLSLVPAYAEAFGRLKTDIASVYFIGTGKAKPEEVLFSMTLFALISSFVVVLILFWQIEFLNNTLFQNTEIDYMQELTVLILLIPFEFLLLNYGYFYIALEDTVKYNRIKVLKATINFSVIVFLILVLDFKLWALVLAKILSTLIPLVYGWSGLDRKGWVGLRLRWNGSLSLELLRYAFNFYVIGIISHIHELTIKTIAAIFLVTSELAFYSQGEAAGKLLNVIPESLRVILYPRISRLETKTEAQQISCQSFRVTLLVLSLSGIVLALIAKPLIILLYGIDFEPTAYVLIVAIPGVVIGGSCLTLKSYFEGIGQANLIPKIQIIPVALQLVFAYLFINWWGLTGAAFAFTLGFALVGLAIFLAFLRITRVPIIEMVPRLMDIKFIYHTVVAKN